MENEKLSPSEQIAFYKEQLLRFHKASLKKQGIDPDSWRPSKSEAPNSAQSAVESPVRPAAPAKEKTPPAQGDTAFASTAAQTPFVHTPAGMPEVKARPLAKQSRPPILPSEGAAVLPPNPAPTPTGQENPHTVPQREDRRGHNPSDGSSAYTGQASPNMQSRADFEKENAQTGFLKTRVTVAREALPLKNAKVSVTKEFLEGRHTYAVLYTDQSGKTEAIALPAPSKHISEEPEENGVRGFSSYDIRVEAPGYVTVDNIDVPVFEDIVSVQPVTMVPESLSQQLNGAAGN